MAVIRQLAVLAVLLFSASLAVRQEYSVYEKAALTEQGNIHTFQMHTPHLPISFAYIRRYCMHGIIIRYSQPNYQGFYSSSQGCWVGSQSNVQSFRYVGASDSSQDAVSLYTGVSYTGTELLITQMFYGGIDVTIQSLGVTGKSAWTLFEGRNFMGKSACVPAPNNIYSANIYSTATFGINTVGSLVKGCSSKSLSPEFLKDVRAEWQAISKHGQ